MSTDLLSQLEEYYTSMIDAQEAIHTPEIAELLDGVRPIPLVADTKRRSSWEPLVVTAAAAAVVVAAIAIPLMLRSPLQDSPIATPDEVTTTTPAPISSSSLTWSRVPHDEATLGGEGFQTMSGVTVGGPGLVAVGSAVWTSTDGITWTRVGDQPLNGSMSDVEVGGPGLVAVGVADDNTRGGDAAVWTSGDGVTWSRVPHDEAVFGGEGTQIMHSVTVGGPGLVAVGAAEEGSDAAAVWTSVDGITWSRVPHDEAIFGGPANHTMNDVTVGGPGLIAVGAEFSASHQNAAVWTSMDGIAWSRAPHNHEVFGGSGNVGAEMWSVTAGGPGLVAVGGRWDGPLAQRTYHAAAWTSSDGVTWTLVPDDETVFGGDPSMRSVTVAGPGMVAAGGATVWTSVDGIRWSRIPHDDAVFGEPPLPSGTGFDGMRSVTASGRSVWVVGSVWRFDDGVRTDDIQQRVTRGEADLDAAIWTATTND
jgi:hypothetical protein